MITDFVLLQDEWVQIGPLGDHPHEQGIQRIDPETAAEMARRFNSLGARLGRLFGGAPVFEGHHDTNPERYPNGRSFAWVTELGDRGAEGLWGRLKWTDTGRKLVKGGNYKFVSPVWRAREIGRDPGNRVIYRPEELLSLALTNLPNLPLPPLANERSNMKTLSEILELNGEPSAEEICAAAERLANERRSQTVRAEELANDLAETARQLDAERQARLELVIEKAILTGRSTLAEKERWREELTKDFAAAEKALSNAASVLNQTSQTELLGNEKALYATVATRREFITGFIMEKMAAGMSHMEAWTLAKTTHPGLFARMEGK